MLGVVATLSFASSTKVWTATALRKHGSLPRHLTRPSCSATKTDWNRVLQCLTPFAEERRILKMNDVLAKRRGGLHIVLDSLADPFDVSAILRTVEGLGVQHVHQIEPKKPQAPSPSPIKGRRKNRARRKAAEGNVAMGAVRWLSVHKYQSAEKCHEVLKSKGLQVFVMCAPEKEGTGRWSLPVSDIETADVETTYNHRALSVDKLPLRVGQGVALVFSELQPGARNRIAEFADVPFFLPMSGITQVLSKSPKATVFIPKLISCVRTADHRCCLLQSFSISLSCATAIYTVISSGFFPEGSLDEGERVELLARWLLRDVRGAKHILKQKEGLDIQ